MHSVSSNSINSGALDSYLTSRRRWEKPQAMIWSRNPGEVVKNSGAYVGLVGPKGREGTDFIVISDHNRSPISMDMQRIESRSRMVSGNMRSYYTDDKVVINTSWNLLPSRAYQTGIELMEVDKLDSEGQPTGEKILVAKDPNNIPYNKRTSPYSQAPYDAYPPNSEYTADGGAGAVDMLDWYYNTIGPMWVFLSYDRFDNTAGALNGDGTSNQFNLNANYTDRKKMFFSAFNYSVEKRGLYDMWNISVSLEEA